MTHIVTLGGGAFSTSDGGATALDRYLVELSGKDNPLVCFAPTASADDPAYVAAFLKAYGGLGVRTTVLTLWKDAERSIERLTEADVLVAGGGSTVNCMALWDAHGVSTVLRDLRAEGDIVLAGAGAGASVFYEACTTDSFGEHVQPWRGGLGFLRGSFCPHYGQEAERAPQFGTWVAAGDLPVGWGADDGAGIHWLDGRVVGHLAEKPGARTYRVDRDGSVTAQVMQQI
ncbi:Type 1 glutamine amidotransferase-like domain-containing protein [Arsenicicoccus piscis]|uniref:Peptidase YgaJ n=1 Tax=Arsenicicoccus piscis TaxID=673954 RepID=A0ABQ6HUM7_9MICO|nr:Type 1 glutamine amidotransferase-like domain-containing protein [Arsenicicoccus piscis]MCH8626581.1 Type 1 glutamine amidotransferase-like domain-containing protein [Arsenicicoccus piscis]GMA21229.1 putative peptidase YgaJ [Arsenicicoccus piscis]